MSSGKSGPGGGTGRGKDADRRLAKRVKTARGRKTSSTLWLQRQLNDPYVAEARRLGYRSRAAFKLIELDDKFRLLKPNQSPNQRIVDLGAAPGGWAQICVERLKLARDGEVNPVIGMDLQAIESMAGAEFLQHDFMDDDAPDLLKSTLGGPADLVLSDMSPATTGHKSTDHLRIMALSETAAHFAAEVLAQGGAFVAKVFQGGAENDLLNTLKRDFAQVRHFKPPASRSESAETYVVAQGFRGGEPDKA
ncbi:MAG: RlmE family RNA methyltransferase [Pseudomonadota bacterium]